MELSFNSGSTGSRELLQWAVGMLQQRRRAEGRSLIVMHPISDVASTWWHVKLCDAMSYVSSHSGEDTDCEPLCTV